MEDLRIKRTYKLLKEALFELLSKKSFDEIKVVDICELAMVHRTTFYSHFSDKYELLEYCINDVEQELTEKISNNIYSNTEEFYTNLIINVIEYISDKKKLFKNIIKNNLNSSIISIFNRTCVNYIKSVQEEDKVKKVQDIPIEIIAQFYSGAVMSTIVWWLESNSKLTEKELCKYIADMIFRHIDA